MTRLLSDFDGVWTFQHDEAEAVRHLFLSEVVRLSGESEAQVAEDFAAVDEAVHADPTRYGWAPGGVLTAFVDEDPFCRSNAWTSYLLGASDPAFVRYREAILAGSDGDLDAFGDRCFLGATGDFRRNHPPALVPEAAECMQRLIQGGIEVTVVSNSPSSKILDWFSAVGIDLAAEGVSVRGEAGKQLLTDTPRYLEACGRRVRVDRDHYRAVLEEVRPDVVIGDVFSLDLSLPHTMRDQGGPSTLVLRGHGHTPAWSHELARTGFVDSIVPNLGELVKLVEGLECGTPSS